MNAGDKEEVILSKMISCFGPDTRRILHAQNVLRYAKELLENEAGDRNVVVAAAILHDIGIKECERKYNSTNGQLQEKEGPSIAAEILKGVAMDKEDIEEVCSIIASHHSPGEIDTANFKIIWDSDWLVNLKDEFDVKDRRKLKNLIDKIFLTKTGRAKAKNIYCGPVNSKESIL